MVSGGEPELQLMVQPWAQLNKLLFRCVMNKDNLLSAGGLGNSGHSYLVV
jgi:hypothetical protein